MKRTKNNIVLLAILILALMGSIPVQAADQPKDQRVAHWVKEALREDPRVAASNITVNTNSGIVTLTGLVRDLAAKTYADEEAKKVNGVLGVVNRIVVKPKFRYDADIAQDVKRRLTNSSMLMAYGFGVLVDNGEVSLAGTVASWTEKKQATLLASEVRGVKAVHNHITIDYPLYRSDEEIRRDVITTIDRDVYLNGLPISVSVKKGVVTLEGTVGNAYQKDRAWEDAWVYKVEKVNDKMKVEWWEERGVRKKTPTPSDSQLESAVHNELYQDLRIVRPYEIIVDASSGHVTLRGVLPTYHQKRLAEQDAHDVVGVAWVSNLLSVKAAERADSAILRDVQFQIDSDSALSGQDIGIHVKDGVVKLFGNVSNTYEKTHAADVVSRVLGVREVIDNLAVNSWRKYPDAALRKRIEERLAATWETRMTSDQIKVEVKDGLATLTGDVDTWLERKEAAHVALFTDGIWGVDNLLTVKGADYPWDEWHYHLPE